MFGRKNRLWKRQETVEDAREKLGRDGRLIVRPSGTEAVIRVMAEGDDSHLVETLVTQVCNALKETEEAA